MATPFKFLIRGASAASFVLIVACSAQSSPSDPLTAFKSILPLTINIDQSGLENAQVILQSELHNTSDQTLTFLPWNTPFDTGVSGRFLTVVDTSEAQPQELPYLGRLIKRRAAQAADYLDVPPGATLKRDLDITASYSFCRGRHYRITFTGMLNQPDYTAIEINLPQVEFSTGEPFPKCDITEHN